jgi:hypothetical protein
VLTEVDGAGDADLAPNGPGGFRWSDWAARG